MTAPRRRLFVALVPSAQERGALAAAAAELRHGGRAVPAENLHLTLAFLGTVDAAATRAAATALAGVRGPPFELAFSRVGHFPRPRVLWAAAPGAPAALYALQGAVARALGEAGFEQEPRPFTPHVTVARNVARWRGPEALPRAVAWRLDAVTLVASRTLPRGARYRSLLSVRLQAPG